MARVAYLVGRYPAVSHTFITQEVRALRRLGVDIVTFAIWRTSRDQLLTALDRQEAARTRTLLPPTQRWVRNAQSAAINASPAAYAKLVKDAYEFAPAGLRGRMLAASWVVEAAALWRACNDEGISHIHVHLNGTAPSVALLATRFAHAVGQKHWTWSMTVHGPAEFYAVENEALSHKIRGATYAVCISDFARSQLMAFVDEQHWGKLHVVHCGVDARTFAPPEQREPGKPLRLLCVARLTQIKGQAVALEAVSELRRRGVEAHLTLVGDGPKRYDLERLAERLQVADRVSFEGAVGHDRIRDYYLSADAFVLTSFAEGIPVVLMEAMSAGLPVIASNVMGVGELVRDGGNGILVRPGRPDAVAAAIERLADNPDLHRELGTAARETVVADFSIEGSARRLADLLASVERSDAASSASREVARGMSLAS